MRGKPSEAAVSRLQSRLQHWEQVWVTRDPTRVTWYQPSLQRSLGIIDRLPLALEDPVIDIGGGASTLVDDLLGRRFRDVTVLDVSAAALEKARVRLGSMADPVRWLQADVTTAALPESRYGLWHDRAVFHFLVEEEDRASYTARLRTSIRPGGYAVIATFGPDGPTQCSGLPTRRYSTAELVESIGSDLELVDAEIEEHVAVSGVRQQFLYAVLRRRE